MSKLNDMYVVLECKGVPGLTVGSHVIKPGGKFTRAAWPYEEKALEAAVKDNRCKLISGKAPEKKAEAKPEVKPEAKSK